MTVDDEVCISKRYQQSAERLRACQMEVQQPDVSNVDLRIDEVESCQHSRTKIHISTAAIEWRQRRLSTCSAIILRRRYVVHYFHDARSKRLVLDGGPFIDMPCSRVSRAIPASDSFYAAWHCRRTLMGSIMSNLGLKTESRL